MHFMGNEEPQKEGESAKGTKFVRQRSGTNNNNNNGGGNVNPQAQKSIGDLNSVVSDSELSRRIGTAAKSADAAENDTPEAIAAAEAASALMEEQDADLLRQSLIKATGGISGLGVSQLSDNDKFSCLVKYLLDFDRFKEVSFF